MVSTHLKNLLVKLVLISPGIGVKILQIFELPPPSTSRINPVSKWLVTPIYKPFRPSIYTGNNPIQQKMFPQKILKKYLAVSPPFWTAWRVQEWDPFQSPWQSNRRWFSVVWSGWWATKGANPKNGGFCHEMSYSLGIQSPPENGNGT